MEEWGQVCYSYDGEKMNVHFACGKVISVNTETNVLDFNDNEARAVTTALNLLNKILK